MSHPNTRPPRDDNAADTVHLLGVGRFLLPALIGLICFFLMSNNFDVSLWLGAARDVLHGVNPYHVDNLINPIIVPLLFVPFAPLPDALVARLLACASGVIAVTILRREARHRWVIFALLISPIFLYSIFFVNLDWLVALALLVSPVPAFFLAMLKPQIGIAVAGLALLRMSKPLAVLCLTVEVLIYAASYALGMRWSIVYAGNNFSLFPYGLIVGLPLMLIALRRRDAVIAFAAMPFCAPYVGLQSWIAVLPLLARYTPIMRRGGFAVESAYPPVNGLGNAP